MENENNIFINSDSDIVLKNKKEYFVRVKNALLAGNTEQAQLAQKEYVEFLRQCNSEPEIKQR